MMRGERIRSDVDAGPYRSRGVPWYPNRRKHWRADVEDCGYYTVCYWPTEDEYKHSAGGWLLGWLNVLKPRWFPPATRRFWRTNARPRR